MTEMNLFLKQQESGRHREETCGCQGEDVEEWWSGRLGLADILPHYGLLQDSECGFLCYRIGPWCSSLYNGMYMYSIHNILHSVHNSLHLHCT